MEEPQTETAKQRFIRKKTLQTDLDTIRQEMYKRNLELVDNNKTLSLLRTVDTLALESHETLDVLAKQISAAIATAGEFPFVAILSHVSAHSSELEVSGWSTSGQLAHATPNDLDKIRIATDAEWFKSDARNLSINLKRASADKIARTLQITHREAVSLHATLPLQALHLVKLTARQRLVGVIAIGLLHGVQELSHSDTMLMDRLSDAVGVAIDNKLLFEENQRVVHQLQKTNQKLKELDEAKDEFISMASHQLRTPLTSVKGYMSMVLDGDAGKLAPKQTKLLDQAFISSQRMVYLIADLLNVSRLKTGKFVIEPSPTNLAEVVAGEVSQLVETAKSRKLELVYKKPKKFPTVMLDETKTRQVVMNFIDNAIYYTPAGGRIEVAVQDKDGSVVFTVTDNGLGVPKDEQHHLFTKFYRANNAKQARPDGTGLGLFMAKKVVIAQGGAIVFKSKEGVGSTFGFTFSKKKLTSVKPAAKSS